MRTNKLSIAILIRNTLLAALFVAGSLPATALALDEQFYSSNSILYYDPSGANVCTPGGGQGGTLPGSNNEEKIWNFLKQEGFSDEQAAGIMGNIRQESNYDPDAEEGNGVGYGLIQWSFTRRDALEEAARDAGMPVSDLAFQLDYLKSEASNAPLANWRNLFEIFSVSSSDNAWDALKNINGIDRTTTFFHDAFERSADYESEHYGYSIEHRIDFAKEVYDKFKGQGGSGGSGGLSASNSPGCNNPFAGGNFNETLLAFAHPDYHEPVDGRVAPEPLPAYVEAATRIQDAGKFVGGGNGPGGAMPSNPFPGIDCGGFVGILLTESGFEPDYNYGLDFGKGAGATATQEQWMKENWEFLGTGGPGNNLNLQPGDVAINPAHTFLYVGSVPNFNAQFASASYGPSWRAPMAGFEDDTDPSYNWYRKRG